MRVLLNTKVLVLSDKTGIGYYVFNLFRELQRSAIDIVPTIGTGSQVFVNSLSRASFYIRKLFPEWPPVSLRRLGDIFIKNLWMNKTGETIFDLYHETSLDAMPRIKARKVLNIYDLSFISCPDFLVKDFAESVKVNVTGNIPLADRIIVNTEFIKGEVMDIFKIPGERIDVIPLAPAGSCNVNPPRPPHMKRFTRKDYILYVGTVEPRKNLKTLIRAFRDIRQRYDISLMITGRLGWLYDDIIAYPEQLGIKEDVIFTHYVDEDRLRYLYNNALLFVYPSLYEGFGIPPLEAMTCGVPVIVSDILPLREVAGEAALFFNPQDHEELAATIDRVLSSESLRSEMIKKGLKRAGEYSWSRVAASTIQTYKRALE